jgi:hypothetical protein
MKKNALGIFIDGQTLRAALLSKREDEVRIEMMEAYDLYSSLDLNGSAEALPDQSAMGEGPNDSHETSEMGPFGFNSGESKDATDPSAISEANTNFDIIIDMLNRMCPKGASLAFNLCDSATLYKNIPVIAETKIHKIKRTIWKELNEETSSEPDLENVGFIKRQNGSYLGMVHDDPLVLSTLLLETIRVTKSRPPKIELIDAIEFALAHEIRVSYNVQESEHIAILLFAKSFTKVFFMRGPEIETVLPTIHEGAESKNVCETIFSKILFEFDSGNIGPLHRMILVGEIDKSKAEQFFHEKLPTLNIQRFESGRVSLAPEVEPFARRIAYYGVPIALALKQLESKIAPPYNQNFLPRRIRDKQSVYKVAWHGFAMLGVLFLCAFFLSFESFKKAQEIQLAQASLASLNQELNRLSSVQSEVDSIRTEISSLEKGSSLLDSLAQSTTRWTPIVETFSDAFNRIGVFSIVHLETPAPGTLLVDAELTTKEQVANLERFIAKSKVISVINTKEEGSSTLKVTLECRVNQGSPNAK